MPEKVEVFSTAFSCHRGWTHCRYYGKNVRLAVAPRTWEANPHRRDCDIILIMSTRPMF